MFKKDGEDPEGVFRDQGIDENDGKVCKMIRAEKKAFFPPFQGIDRISCRHYYEYVPEGKLC